MQNHRTSTEWTVAEMGGLKLSAGLISLPVTQHFF